MNNDSSKEILNMKNINSNKDINHSYLEEHSKPATKLLHFIGTAI